MSAGDQDTATRSTVPRKEKGRVLQFAAIPEQAASPYNSSILSESCAAEARSINSIIPRNVSPFAYKVLDAPRLMDDFYSNLIDWSRQGLLAVALGADLHVYNTVTSKPFKVATYEVMVRSVAWSQSGAHLSVGLHSGKVDLWDINKMSKVRSFAGHSKHVTALSWNSHLLSSAGSEGIVLNHDMRVPENSVAAMKGHRSTISGLKWSHDDRQLASGGNDNLVCIWRAGMSKPQQRITAHTACVKALAWSPHHAGLLATGGGTQDQTIALWNTVKASMIHSIHTGSQVSGLAWSHTVNELLSIHGYATSALHIWKAPSMVNAATLTGHNSRVLFLAMSPDGQTAATGDETVRFWRVFPKDTAKSATAKLVRSEGKVFAPERPNPLPPPPAPRPLLLKPASEQQQSQQAMPASTALLEEEAHAGKNMAAHCKDDKMADVGLHVQHED
ncbi:MAG: hypothetical protein FRX49_06818 [Trebouxia sp. A1-2]|nr:MAG: hypothetical protein FRX49_06818 [Trebouxia sp. A1-2]